MATVRDPLGAPVEYSATDQADLRAAYNRGREDERRNRRHHPIIALVVVVLALIGAWMLFLAAREGSFSSAGQVADKNISTAADQAGPALRDTGDALKDAGTTVKQKSEDIVQRPSDQNQQATGQAPAR